MKGVITIGYRKLVMDLDHAVALAKAMSTAEIYQTKWRSTEDGGTTHHIYEDEPGEMSITLISDDLYRMAKLAGKP